MTKSKKTTMPDTTYATFGVCLLVGLLFITVGHLYYKCASLQDEIINENKQLHRQYTALQEEVAARRKVYVYNLEEILNKTDVLKTKKQFEEDIIKLNDELVNGEKKIKSLKSAKLKEDFSEIYLNSLRVKRDELVSRYDKTLDDLAGKINKALEELCAEKNIPTVFFNGAIAATTDDVIDVTDEVIEKLKKQ